MFFVCLFDCLIANLTTDPGPGQMTGQDAGLGGKIYTVGNVFLASHIRKYGNTYILNIWTGDRLWKNSLACWDLLPLYNYSVYLYS